MQAMVSDDNLKKEELLCKTCLTESLGFGEAMCKTHGNEFIDWKCMYCCSIAVFYCVSGRYTFCTPCHNDIMAGTLKDKILSKCLGGPGCPLNIPSHPEASDETAKSKYPLGCSLCRSEKVAQMADNKTASAGVNLERRGSMIKRFGGVHGHDIGREMAIREGDQAARNMAELRRRGVKPGPCIIF